MAGFMYHILNVLGVSEVGVIAEAMVEKEVFLREHASGAYSILAYHIFWFVKLGWRAMRNGLLFSALCYFTSGLNITVAQFFTFALFMSTISMVASGLSLLLVVLIPDTRGASDLHNMLIGTFGTFAGYFLIPEYFQRTIKFTYYISFYTYAYEGLLWNEYTHGNGGFNETFEYLADTFTVNCVLNQWTNLMVLSAFPVFFHSVSMALTWYNTRPQTYWDARKHFRAHHDEK